MPTTTTTVTCALCQAYGMDGTTSAATATEIPFDRERDGAKRKTVHACRDCASRYRHEILGLRQDARAAGDVQTVEMCTRALDGDHAAATRCLELLQERGVLHG